MPNALKVLLDRLTRLPACRLTGAVALLLTMLALSAPAQAGKVHVAAATNFTETARRIGEAFEQTSGHSVVFSFGSTGQLYAQIAQGAPFDVFLSADRERAAKAVDEGLAVANSQFTYAAGKLVLYSAEPGLVNGENTLKTARFSRLAITNPNTAPYGAAAMEVLQAVGVKETLESKLVKGNNIAQTYQFIDTGNAELGFIALSQVINHDEGSRWIVPEDLYSPIAQDAVLLEAGSTNAAARAFLEFLQGEQATAITESFGYGVP